MVVLDGVEDLCMMLLLLGVESRFVDFPFLFTFFFLIYYLFIYFHRILLCYIWCHRNSHSVIVVMRLEIVFYLHKTNSGSDVSEVE